MINIQFYLFIYYLFIWQHQNLKSGPQHLLDGALPLELLHQSFFVLGIF
jgi:hypothetical protein